MKLGKNVYFCFIKSDCVKILRKRKLSTYTYYPKKLNRWMKHIFALGYRVRHAKTYFL